MNVRPYLQFNRKISQRITAVLVKTPLKPNHITTLALLSGWVAAWVMSDGTRTALLWGAFWLHISFILDNCDGEVARLKSLVTLAGKRYDLLADVAVELALWTGLAIGSLQQGAGVSVIVFAGLAYMGSLFNCAIVVSERTRGVGDSIHVESAVRKDREQSTFFSLLEFFNRNGDIIALVWILALIGSPQVFLVTGAVFMNALSLTRFLVNRKHLQ